MNTQNLTPMMKKYLELKEKAGDAILFFRLGDFYEMFFEDAEIVSKAIGLTLTGRDCGLEKRAPMCGIPHHAAHGYLKRLVDAGFKVAIAEQLTTPQKGVKMVERDIVKIITPGTINEIDFLDSSQNNYLASVYHTEKAGAICWADISTGQFYAIQIPTGEVGAYQNVLDMIMPREIICNSSFKKHSSATDHYDYAFMKQAALSTIKKYFNISDTIIFDFGVGSEIVNSAGALLEYIIQTQKNSPKNILKITRIRDNEYMLLDKAASDNLELTHQYRDTTKKYGTLLWLLDETKTSMGARALRNVIMRPLQDIEKIKARHIAISAIINGGIESLQNPLSQIQDISRLAGRIAANQIMPREMVALAGSLDNLRPLKENSYKIESPVIKELSDNISLIEDAVLLIKKAINPDSPIKLEDGGFINKGFDAKLDELLAASTQGMSWLAKLEAAAKEETGIKELKIGFNRVSGYYFEAPMKFSKSMPYTYTRRATTANTERYITAELKELEEKILGVNDKIKETENKLLQSIRAELMQYIPAIIQNAESIAMIDVLASLANVSKKYKWVMPTMNNDSILMLKDARHPVLAQLIGQNKFISNDCAMASDSCTTMLITGPNMAGKSTYMRTVAINILMAHIGCFVACKSASVPIIDRIFTRIGASDNQLIGQSTFMIEMNEVSRLIHGSTKNSLILLDEVGRGTGTQEGRALASAITSYVTDKIGAMTMFATHFHELAELAQGNPKIKNYRALTSIIDGEIVFLHKIEPGKEEQSFGIDVAKLAGIPREVLENARKIYNMDRASQMLLEKNEGEPVRENTQNKENPSAVAAKLKEIDTNRLSPMEALVMLSDLAEEARKS